jgi:copper(I)-binding protein
VDPSRRRRAAAVLAVVTAGVALSACGGSAGAAGGASEPRGHARARDLLLTGAYIPGPGMPGMASGYLVVTDRGAADRLLHLRSPAFGSVTVDRGEGGSATAMTPVGPPLPVPAHGRLALVPGGRHLMLMRPRRSLHVGDSVPLTLTFARTGRVRLAIPVVATSAVPGNGGMPGMPGM